MALKKPSKPSVSPFEKKTTKHVSATGAKRYLHWICAPGNVCLPTEERELFTDSPQWKIFRIMAEFVEGFEFLSTLKQEVSIFGSARTMPGDRYYKLAKELGFKLAERGYSVITGGGPGIMEAANRGAFESGKGHSVGLNIQLPIEQRTNQWVKKGMGFHYFFTRKVMLSASAQAYVFFPGGFGTLDEMSEMVTLIQTGKIPDNVPVILFGSSHWGPFMEWIKQSMLEDASYISEIDLSIMHIVDTADEAVAIIKETNEREFG